MLRRHVTLRGEHGRLICRCELADSFLTRLRGLLGRRGLATGEGLLIAPAPSVHTCFMRFAIDAVFLDADFRVLEVRPHLRPWRLAGARGARHVLELRAGGAAAADVRPGHRLLLDPPDEG